MRKVGVVLLRRFTSWTDANAEAKPTIAAVKEQSLRNWSNLSSSFRKASRSMEM